MRTVMRATAMQNAKCKMKKEKWAAGLALLSLLCVAGCGKKPDTAEAGGAPGAGGAKGGPAAAVGTAVSVAPVTVGNIERAAEVTGSLVALQDVVVGAKQAGR